jgi:superfamily II DNA or RNA helicase
LSTYAEFLSSKSFAVDHAGLEIDRALLNPSLFDFQRDLTAWSLRKGRSALFCDCGLGKTVMQLDWAKHVPGKVLILAPLAVSQQTVREGEKFGIEAVYSRRPVSERITITNYEMLEHFHPSDYAGIVLDESSILKSYSGKVRNQIISAFERSPYRLACTATPSPNDYMELGNHSEFLDSLTRTEMLSTFFVHDGGDTSEWRVKRHAEKDFWKWVCSWAVMMRKPSDLGYEDGPFTLPALNFHERTVAAKANGHSLVPLPASTLAERREARKSTIRERTEEIASLVAAEPDTPWLIWCNLNSESELASKLIPNAQEVTGSQSIEEKEEKMLAFSAGKIPVLVTKPSIAGLGMNWQHCHKVAFLGLSDSYEQFYQAIRRCWRFGQKSPVDCYIVTADNEGAVTANIKRKEADAARMAEEMVNNMHELNQRKVHQGPTAQLNAIPRRETGEKWEMVLGDCVEEVSEMESDSIDYSIFSPPFASLYTYSDSARDMGNCRTHAEFCEHFRFLTGELYRIIKPGRCLSFHCMNLPVSKERDGFIGLADFRGDLIRIFQDARFIYHSEVCIWKDPVTAMQRTKALGLLHKQLKKDSCMSRQGIADYLVTMRKHGVNPSRVTHTNETFPVSEWQEYASPVWADIDPSDTLQRESAREQDDERHICPLQLEVIRRAMRLWSTEDDLVLSPFAGIGSEGYIAVQMNRYFKGIELKESYWKQAVANLKNAVSQESLQFAPSA